MLPKPEPPTVAAGKTKIDFVENVKGFRSEFKGQILMNWEEFDDGKVVIEREWSSKGRRRSWQISELK